MSAGDAYTVLLFAVGPVQDFIATARKGQDLWFGSWLLSEMSRVAARAAHDEGAELVMPTLDAVNQGDAVANKVVVRVQAAQVAAVARAMEQAARARLVDLGNRVFERVARTADGRYLHREAAKQQLDDLPEFYWVAVDEVPNAWGATRQRAEAALAARKSLRDFHAVTWGAPVPKSQLDGSRESVIDEAAFALAGGEHRVERLRQNFGIGRGERLCGVGLVKRLGRHVLTTAEARGARVISTAHVASWSLRRAWAQSPGLQRALHPMFRAYLEALPDRGAALSEVPADHSDPVTGRVDGQALFEGRLAEIYDGEDLIHAARALREFLRQARAEAARANVSWPVLSPYYAVLRADGDRMGLWLDGLTSPDQHRRASAALGQFAHDAGNVVARHHGHCVFAGGDDVLALVPVAAALGCAKALNEAFEAAVRAGPVAPGGAGPSLSVGLQIAHATDPFRDALAGAALAEHAAKLTYGRSAFAVQLDKRSGAPLLVGGKWSQLDALAELQTLQDCGARSLPRGLAYDLRRISERLDPRRQPDGVDTDDLARVRMLEFRRVAQQKRDSLDARAWDALLARLGSGERLDVETLNRLSRELIVTRALAALDAEEA
jgi:CRISPR-associated protein Cmr2